MNDRSSAPLPDIVRDFPRASPELVKQASQYASSILADVAGRRGALDGRIAPLTRTTRLAGTAFTVEVRPGDNLMIHAAMQLAKPGDVLVIDGKGDTTCALMGTIMMNACVQLGIAGVVIDAAVRKTIEGEGGDVLGGTPEQFRELIRTDTVSWAKEVKSSGAKVD